MFTGIKQTEKDNFDISGNHKDKWDKDCNGPHCESLSGLKYQYIHFEVIRD